MTIEVLLEHAVVVARHRVSLAEALGCELAVAKMPSECAVHVPVVAVPRVRSRIGRQHANVVSPQAEVFDRRAPDEFVPAEVVWRIHVADRENPHRDEDKVPSSVDGPPSVSIVVASHGRPLRLRWLLNAVDEQTFAENWEVVVVHTYAADVAERVLEHHPLCDRGELRHIPIDSRLGSPARQRNVGWREARAPLVAFTDDDCRPEPEWLARLVDAARRHPGAIVQGATRPDPLESAVLAAPHVRTLFVEPVGPYAQTCNILYPLEVLERLGGFDERAVAGEDVGLSLRARAIGCDITPAPEAVVYHAVESHTLPGIICQNLKWRHLAYLVKRHPEFRRQMPLRIFWDRDHLRTCALLVGLATGYRRRALLGLTLPYVIWALNRRGSGRRARLIAAAEMPGQAVRQAAEVAGLAAGAVTNRTVVL